MHVVRESLLMSTYEQLAGPKIPFANTELRYVWALCTGDGVIGSGSPWISLGQVAKAHDSTRGVDGLSDAMSTTTWSVGGSTLPARMSNILRVAFW